MFKNNIVPSSINGGAEMLLGSRMASEPLTSTASELARDLQDNSDVLVQGTSMVRISTELCATADRFLCVRYVTVSDLTPPFRDNDGTNDWACADVAHYLTCNDGLYLT